VNLATDGGRISYRMAKAALNQQTASLAADFVAEGINVALVAIHPGDVPTRMSGGAGNVKLSDSARGIVQIAKKLRMETSGEFLDYRGESLDW
jgi:NAD(P)-dependent dehydrogenase (short-subunit alcohol dehydrogenase family)